MEIAKKCLEDRESVKITKEGRKLIYEAEDGCKFIHDFGERVATRYDNKGNKLKETYFISSNNEAVLDFQTGKLRCFGREWALKDGKLVQTIEYPEAINISHPWDQPWEPTKTFPSRTCKIEVDINGRETGYFSDGEKYEKIYQSGEKYGKSIHYDANGKVKTECDFAQDPEEIKSLITILKRHTSKT